MAPALKDILDFCQEYNMLPPGTSVLVCVSGGTDSMCLLHVLHSLEKPLGLRLTAAHFNHQLRGAESDGDQRFVGEYCAMLGIPLVSACADVKGEAARRGRGVEETARELRYGFFFKTAGELGIDRVATAHNADDNLETVLMRIARGSGSRGLAGIPPVRGRLIRPLLPLTRARIEEYNRERGVPHREDSSNASDDYTRNLLRHRVLPVLREINPNLNVTALTRLLREDDDMLCAMAEEHLRRNSEGDALSLRGFDALPRPVASRVVRKFCGEGLSFDHVESVLKLIASADPSASLDLPGLCVRREYDKLVIGGAEGGFEPRRLGLDSCVIIGEAGIRISARKCIGDGCFYNSLTNFPIKRDRITGELIVRPRKSGDSLRMRGMTRSIKKLFIEKHIPRLKRGLVPLICDGSGVIAVCGVGMDESYLPSGQDPAVMIEIEKMKEK